MNRAHMTRRHGFTLVELALVLVIVGLLITGVLKGEALIQNAKVKKLVNQKESITAAFYTFYDRYGTYPGDENLSGNPTSDAHEGNGNGQITGNERWYLFEDLVLAGIINGSYEGGTNDVPNNAFGGYLRVEYRALQQGNCVFFGTIPDEVSQMVDTKYDDGIIDSGSIQASNPPYGNGTAKVVYWLM